jgi:putative SOS response-associated peptidase YedK
VCGRYVSALPPAELARIFGAIGALPNVEPSWNVAPTSRRPVIRRHPETGERRLDLLSWGLVPHFIKDLKAARKPINARAETIAGSGMFRGALARRRCIVPADLFYEWRAEKDGKQPFAIGRRDGQVLAFGGLWESWTSPDSTVLRSYAIITTAANDDMAVLHDRMPLVLEERHWENWLGEDAGDAAGLMCPAPAGTLRMWPVARAVNSVRHDGPELVAPIPDGAGVTPEGGPNSK